MQKRMLFLLAFVMMATTSHVKAQYEKADTTFRRYFIGSTLFVLGNLSSKNRPDFAQVNLGYRLTAKDAVSLELKTWKYAWPLGIPFGESFLSPDEEFPGYIREFGFALAYQRFFWKGLYAGVHIMNAWQIFVDETGHKIDNGFQIFNTYRVGYHVKLFKDRLFIEPSLAITHRPFHTDMPDSFKQMDDRWSKFFFGEPGLHFGFKF